MTSTRTLALVLVAAAAGCGDDLQYRFAEVVQVTGASPLVPGCGGEGQDGDAVDGSEVEPMVAVDAADRLHLVGAWQQDRWTTGGSQGVMGAVSHDGGATWAPSHAHFSRCIGGTPANGGDYERSTDPWVSIGPGGVAWEMALAFDNTTANNAMLAARSDDGGATWSEPAVLQADTDPDVFNDKNSITADPTDPGRVFAVWDRLTGQLMPTMPIGTGPAMLARAEGGVWEASHPIYDPGVDEQTIGNIVVILPDGTVVDVFQHLTMISSSNPVADIEVIRSTDHGTTWSAPIHVASVLQDGVADPANGVYIRSGGLPAISVDPVSDEIYVVWEQLFMTQEDGVERDGIAMATSTDGGLTWAPRVQVNQVPTAAAFTPAVAVAADGTLRVSYYDTRDTEAGGPDVFDVGAFLITSHDHGATWVEDRLTGAFDMRQAKVGQVYFLGDYQGLAPDGDQTVPFFAAAMSAPQDPSDIFVQPVE
jgi:hypothetical protein